MVSKQLPAYLLFCHWHLNLILLVSCLRSCGGRTRVLHRTPASCSHYLDVTCDIISPLKAEHCAIGEPPLVVPFLHLLHSQGWPTLGIALPVVHALVATCHELPNSPASHPIHLLLHLSKVRLAPARTVPVLPCSLILSPLTVVPPHTDPFKLPTLQIGQLCESSTLFF